MFLIHTLHPVSHTCTEHLGIDVDAMEEDDLLARDAIVPEDKIQIWDPNAEQQAKGEANLDGDLIKSQTKADRVWAHAASVAHSGTFFFYFDDVCKGSRRLS